MAVWWALIFLCAVVQSSAHQFESVSICLSKNEGKNTLDRWISCLRSVKEAQEPQEPEQEEQHSLVRSDAEEQYVGEEELDVEVPADVKLDVDEEKIDVEVPAESFTAKKVSFSREAVWFGLGLLATALWRLVRRKQVTEDLKQSIDNGDDLTLISGPLGFALATVFHEVLERDVFDHQYTEKELEDILTLAVRDALFPVLGARSGTFTESLTKSFGSCYKVMTNVRSTRKRFQQSFNNLQADHNGLEELHLHSSTTLKEKTEVVEVKGENGQDTNEITEQSSTAIVRFPELVKREPSSLEHGTGIQEPATNTDAADVLGEKFQRLSLFAQNDASEQSFKMGVATRNPFEISRNGSWPTDALSTIRRSVEAQERSNYIKYFSLLHKVKRLSLKREELHLATHANALKRQQVDLNQSRFAFKRSETQDQALLAGCLEFCRRCADDFVAGLLVMCACMAYCSWKHFPLWLAEMQESCTPDYKVKPRFSWQYMSWMYSVAEDNGRFLLCMMKGTSWLLAGAAATIFLVLVVFRRLLSSNNQLMPASIFLVGGCLAGYGGKISIDLLGGNGVRWVVMWGLLCSVHAFSNYFTGVVYSALNKRPDHFISPVFRRFIFHVLLGLVLPAAAGLLAFPRLLQGGTYIVT